MRIARRPSAGLPALLLAVALCAPSGCAGKRRADTPLAPPAEVYQAALAKMARKRYYAARTLLQQALPRVAPDDKDLLPKVQLAIADAFYRDGGLLNYGESLNAYRNFLTYFPDHERADYAQFMVGMSMFRQVLSPDRDQALTLKAIDELNKVESNYPFSPHVQDARRTIEQCRDRLAEHDRLVGWFYQKRKAYGAAIDRYRAVAERHPRYSGTSQLLFDLAQCLLNVGSRVEAEEVLGRLDREDPGGRLSERGRKLLADFDRKRAGEGKKAGLR